MQAVNLILSDFRGVYIPRDFLCDDYNEVAIERCESWGLNENNKDHWIDASTPDSEYYYEAWDWVLQNAEYTCDNGDVYTLHQDGDLWGLCIERMSAEEKHNFGFDE